MDGAAYVAPFGAHGLLGTPLFIREPPGAGDKPLLSTG